MKSILFLILILPFAFYSCDKDDYPLEGTTWEGSNKGSKFFVFFTDDAMLHFGKKTFDMTGIGYLDPSVSDDKVSFSINGTYKYKNNLIITINDINEDEIWEFTVSENKLSLIKINGYEANYKFDFYKK